MQTQTESSGQDATTHHFQAEVSRVLSLVINSLYSNKEVFLRELLSNASDALDKVRFRAITDPELLAADEELEVRVLPDRQARTLTIWDNGIGMTSEQLTEELGTIAHSGTEELLRQLEQQKGDLSLIGQFGVGFYSAYLVADYVEVISRAANERQAHRWASDGKEQFTIEPAERNARGTSVVLHLRDDYDEFLDASRLRQIIRRYSDYLGYPIRLSVEKEEGGEDLETVNSGRALWQQPKSQITDEQYTEFYKHLTHDWEEPLGWKHFKVEGMQEFTGLLFIPARPPFDLYMPETSHGVRLHVKRVFVMEDCKELLPRWLRFVRGVVDSEDLPLNVSRELLQDSQVVRTIRKQVTKQVLDLLDEIANERPADYAKVWRSFGAVIKEGLHFEPDRKDRLAKLLRYETSKSEGELVSLADYKQRMKEEQKAIYYALGESRERIRSSPHLEALNKRDFEVLYMTDPIDQWAVNALTEYEGVPLVSVTDPDLKLDEQEHTAQGKEREQKQEELRSLLDRFRQRLQDWVSEVRVSNRLTDSPVCLVVPEGGLQPWIERMLRASTKEDIPRTKRILEVNPSHKVITNLERLLEREQDTGKVDEWVDLLFDQALLAEGSPVEDPGGFARRLTHLLEEASEAATDGSSS